MFVANNEAGDSYWFDANSIGIDGYNRTVKARVDKAGVRGNEHWVRFDCDGGRMQLIARFDWNNAVATPVPSTDWIHVDESRSGGRFVMASKEREAVCGWRR